MPPTHYYAIENDGGALMRFDTEAERDRWLQNHNLLAGELPANDTRAIRAERRGENDPRAWGYETDPDANAKYAYQAAPAPWVPMEIFREGREADLSPMQALAWWATEDPDGPNISQERCAFWTGVEPETVRTHVRRARDRLEAHGVLPKA